MNTIVTNQDRRGFYHSCDIETYKKLKQVKQFIHWQKIQSNRLKRWNAKLPHNRVKWIYNGHYSEKALAISFTKWDSQPIEKPQQCPISLEALKRDYINAKVCYERMEDVKPNVLTIEAIDNMVENCQRWLSEINAI
jgi:hypothetical protein